LFIWHLDLFGICLLVFGIYAMFDALWDVAVVGAGAAGLLAATRAAERGKRTILLEKNRKPGLKILMSGGTRCNITHATDNRGIVEAYGPPGRFLHSALAALSVDDTIALFEAEGVATKVVENGKIFPVSNRASDVLAALLRRLERSGAALALGEPLVDLNSQQDSFTIETPKRAIATSRIILTTGGQSYPGSGTTGDGYRIAVQFGHTIVPPRPALVPLTVATPWVADLRGITVPDVGVRILDNGKVLAVRRGSLLFAHFGLSGPVILDVSRAVSGHTEPQRLLAELDLLPAMHADDVIQWLRSEASLAGKKQVAGILAGKIPRRLADILMLLAGVPLERLGVELKKEERTQLARLVKQLPVALTGTLGFKKAEVTAGGVALDEVDSRTMQSKKVPNLFLAGEVLDLDGPIGGYNFQAAWSTGWLAGSSV
jgi:predicted Rossmann fold flavoprotein